jgi:hypothetical protein
VIHELNDKRFCISRKAEKMKILADTLLPFFRMEDKKTNWENADEADSEKREETEGSEEEMKEPILKPVHTKVKSPDQEMREEDESIPDIARVLRRPERELKSKGGKKKSG